MESIHKRKIIKKGTLKENHAGSLGCVYAPFYESFLLFFVDFEHVLRKMYLRNETQTNFSSKTVVCMHAHRLLRCLNL